MNDLCRVTADLRRYEDEQAKPVSEPSDSEYIAKMEKHLTRLSDVRDDETINALIENPSAFKNWFNATSESFSHDMVYKLSDKQRDEICIYSRILVKFMRDTMEASMKKVVEEELRDEL